LLITSSEFLRPVVCCNHWLPQFLYKYFPAHWPHWKATMLTNPVIWLNQ